MKNLLLRLLVLILPVVTLQGCQQTGRSSSPDAETHLIEQIWSETDPEKLIPYLEYGFDYDLLKRKMAEDSQDFGDPIWDRDFAYLSAISHNAFLALWDLAQDNKEHRELLHETWLDACRTGNRPQTLILLSPVGGRSHDQGIEDIRTILEELDKNKRYCWADEFFPLSAIHYDALVVALYRYVRQMRHFDRGFLNREDTELLLNAMGVPLAPARHAHVERMWRRIATLTISRLLAHPPSPQIER
jgi:hypothetical protein